MLSFEIFLLAVGLSVDATVAAFTHGTFVRNKRTYEALRLALCLALFQGIMPILGWALAQQFYKQLSHIDHWIAFTIFSALGIKLIYDTRKEEVRSKKLSFSRLMILGLATSIDALVAGISLSFIRVGVIGPSLVIGLVTFGASLGGFWVGQGLHKFNRKALEFGGGILLIFLGFKILWQHLTSS